MSSDILTGAGVNDYKFGCIAFLLFLCGAIVTLKSRFQPKRQATRTKAGKDRVSVLRETESSDWGGLNVTA